jgi:hypothetical protein
MLALKFTLSKDIDSAVSPGDKRLLYRSIDLIEDNKGSLNLSNSENERLEEFVALYGGQLYPVVTS